MCDSGHDSLASDSSASLSLATPSPPPIMPAETRRVGQPPPNITPIGGVPNITSNATLVRPIAFRPTPVKESPAGQGGLGQRPQGQASLSLGKLVGGGGGNSGQIKDFAPGHPLVKKGSKFYGSSQDLSRPSPGPPSSLSKYSSLDRRSLARRLGGGQGGVQGGGQGGGGGQQQLRLAAWEAVDEQQHQPKPRAGKEPERRHSSYNPSSSLTRTPSQNSEYRHRVAQHRLERRQQEKEAQQQQQQQQQQQAPPTNPIHVSGLPDPFRQTTSNPYVTTTQNNNNNNNNSNSNSNNNNNNNPYLHGSPPSQGTRPASVRSSDGRVRLSGAGTPQFQNLSVSRLSQSSLTNLANLHHNNYHSNTSTTSTSNNNNGLKRTDSARKSNVDPSDHQTFLENEESYQTPSPADSAVGDLEQVLREKEGEIVYLRDTLEQNEQVIFRVYEEKEKTWEREIRKIKGLYETQLKTHQMKASKMEAALANQTYQVQSEKRKLEQEVVNLNERTRLQEEENVRLKSEVSFLREQLADADDQGEAESESRTDQQGEDKRSSEDRGLKEQLETYKEEVRQAKEVIDDLMANRKTLADEVAGLKSLLNGIDEDFSLHEVKAQKAIIIERDQELEQVKSKLRESEEAHAQLRKEHDHQVEQFEVETANWLSEKEKVIRYQKQLQLNYVSMYKKNKTLEQEMEQLKLTISDSQENRSSSKPSSSGGHVSSAKAKLFSKFSSKFSD